MRVSSKTLQQISILLLYCSYLTDSFLVGAKFSIRDAWMPSLAETKGKTALVDDKQLNEEQRVFVMGYLNKHHGDLLRIFAEAFSPIGQEMAKANAWSGGSYTIEAAEIVRIDREDIELNVTVRTRDEDQRSEQVRFPLNAYPIGGRRRYYETVEDVPEDPNRLLIDDIVRRLCRLCWIVKQPVVTGKLIQLAIQLNGSGIGKIPENLFLNQVPHNRYVRKYFYDTASEAVKDAVVLCSEKRLTNRMKVVSMFPEMNPSMDSYRIGTILEMVRAITIKLAEQNLRVKVCVQGSMGVGIFTGVPKQLSGVSRLVQMMDWQSGEGEENQGMVGDYVRFGGVGADQVMDEEVDEQGRIIQYQDDAFVVIAPQVTRLFAARK